MFCGEIQKIPIPYFLVDRNALFDPMWVYSVAEIFVCIFWINMVHVFIKIEINHILLLLECSTENLHKLRLST